MKLKHSLLLLLFFTLLVNLNAAKFQINMDIGIFYTNDGDYNIEFYYSYADNNYTLKYVDSLDLYYGNIEFDLTIDSVNTNKNILSNKWQVPFKYKKDTSNYVPQDLYGIRKITMPNGEYLAKIIITDLNDTNRKEIKEFNIKKTYKKNELQISTIQITNKIIPKTTTPMDSSTKLSGAENTHSELFYKNQYYVYPNPLREISSAIPTLYLYSEIYNAKLLSPDGLNITYTIKDAKNLTILNYDKKKKAVGDAIVETISIPLDATPTGIYTIEMRVCYNKNDDTIIQKNNFYLINNNIEQDEKIYYTEDEQFEMSEFATYSDKRADEEFEKFKILATKSEISTFEKLSDTKAKQRFLYRFWYFRNPNPDNPFNTELATFRERLNYVDTYFSYGGSVNGWKSDRGKIYLQYGEPDYREKNTATHEKKANEIWTYSVIGGGATFCFIDVMGIENYRLMHSNMPGYIQNYNWEMLLNPMSNIGN